MAIRTRIDPIDRDIAALISADLSPAGRSAALAVFARSELSDAEARNAAALGRTPDHETFVDGRRGEALEAVRPDGTIVFEFRLVEDLLLYLTELLARHSPVRTGRYTASHALFADGVEVTPGRVPPAAAEYVFLNTQPYARKIERGLSPQAPDGVYEAVATMAARRFGNQARVRFGFRTAVGAAIVRGKAGDRASSRTPAIVITPR